MKKLESKLPKVKEKMMKKKCDQPFYVTQNIYKTNTFNNNFFNNFNNFINFQKLKFSKLNSTR